jgi:excisionase family DNA binding protein
MIDSRDIKSPGPRAGREHCTRITVPEITQRLGVGRLTVYSMLDQGIIPAVRVRRQWIITRHAYEQWERTCGTPAATGLVPRPEVTVFN